MKLDILHQIVGETRTGKVVVYASDPDHIVLVFEHFDSLDYSADDLLDAHALFEYLSIYATRKNDPLAELYAQHAAEVFRLVPGEIYEGAKSRAGVLTVFDLRNLGQKLAAVEFRDL